VKKEEEEDSCLLLLQFAMASHQQLRLQQLLLFGLVLLLFASSRGRSIIGRVDAAAEWRPDRITNGINNDIYDHHQELIEVGEDGCNCPVSNLTSISSNTSCSNCVFDTKGETIYITIPKNNNDSYSSASASASSSIHNHNVKLFVSFINCTFRHQHVFAALPKNDYHDRNPFLSLHFINCTFDDREDNSNINNSNSGNYEKTDRSHGRTARGDASSSSGTSNAMVSLSSDVIGFFDLSITGCTFLNGIYGAVDVEAYELNLRSALTISQCHFEFVHSSNNTNNNTDNNADNNGGDRDQIIQSHYPAVTIYTYNTSVLIKDSSFVSWSLSYSSSNIHNQYRDRDTSSSEDGRTTTATSRKNTKVTIIKEEEEPKQQQRQQQQEKKASYKSIYTSHSRRSINSGITNKDPSNNNDDSLFVGAAIQVITGDYFNINPTTGQPISSSSTQLNITIDSCKFIDNSAFGGAIHLAEGLMFVVNSTFERNRGALGGAVSVSSRSGQTRFADNTISPPMAVFSQGCQFVDNSASLEGGAVYAANGRLVFSESVFSGNSALYGAVIYADGSNFVRGFQSLTSFYGCSFESRNHAISPGFGIVYALGGVLSMSNSTVNYEYNQLIEVFFFTENTQLNASSVSIDGIAPIAMSGGTVSFVDVSISRSQVRSIANPFLKLW